TAVRAAGTPAARAAAPHSAAAGAARPARPAPGHLPPPAVLAAVIHRPCVDRIEAPRRFLPDVVAMHGVARGARDLVHATRELIARRVRVIRLVGRIRPARGLALRVGGPHLMPARADLLREETEIVAIGAARAG